MQLTAKTNYAIKALIDIASDDSNTPKSLPKIALDQNVALSFLEQIFAELKKAGIVKSIKGPRGGYLLTNNPQNLYLIDVFKAVDESYNVTACKGKTTCTNNNHIKCSSHFFLEDFSNYVVKYLESVSIANLSDKYTNYCKSFTKYEQAS